MVRTLHQSVVVKRESKSEALDLLDDLRPILHLWSRLGEVTESSRLSKQGDTTLFVLLVPRGARPMQLSEKYYDQISLCFTFVSEIPVASTVFVVK